MKKNNFSLKDLFDKMLFASVFLIFVFDVPFLIKPVYKLFRKRIRQKYKNNEKLMEYLKKLEKTME